jgi:hypothetical protein
MAASMTGFVDHWHKKKSNSLYPQYSKEFSPFFEKLKTININWENKESTPPEINDLLKLIRDHRSTFTYYVDYNMEFTPCAIRPKEDCLDDIKAISAEVDTIYFPDGMEYILVKKSIQMYNPHTDVKFDFGLFKIRMYHNEVIVEPIGNNTKRNDCYHPYVRNHRLCLGEYKSPYNLFYKSMRYYDAWLEVYKCLTTYGGDQLNGQKGGPENPMNLWVGFQCEVCKGTMQAEDTVSCVKTRSLICKDCVNTGTCTDETTGEYYLPAFIKQCNSCGKNASSVINNRCLVCRLG